MERAQMRKQAMCLAKQRLENAAAAVKDKRYEQLSKLENRIAVGMLAADLLEEAWCSHEGE